MVAIYDYRLPSPALRDHVRLLQVVGCEFPKSLTHLPIKPYWPRAENCLSFFPKDPEKVEYGFDGKLIESSRSRLYGQHLIATNRHVGRDFMVIQVQFQPGALFRITGIPSNELTNKFIDAEEVFTKEIRLVNERLSYTSHYTEMIAIVENFLMYLIKNEKKSERPIDKVSRFILQKPSVVSLDWLADQACLSPRQFYRQFLEREGISPKLYARVARFENTMRLKNANPTKDWLSIAMELGYYDYQHLVRDFKEFTNLTPNTFLQYESQAPERAFGKIET